MSVTTTTYNRNDVTSVLNTGGVIKTFKIMDFNANTTILNIATTVSNSTLTIGNGSTGKDIFNVRSNTIVLGNGNNNSVITVGNASESNGIFDVTSNSIKLGTVIDSTMVVVGCGALGKDTLNVQSNTIRLGSVNDNSNITVGKSSEGKGVFSVTSNSINLGTVIDSTMVVVGCGALGKDTLNVQSNTILLGSVNNSSTITVGKSSENDGVFSVTSSTINLSSGVNGSIVTIGTGLLSPPIRGVAGSNKKDQLNVKSQIINLGTVEDKSVITIGANNVNNGGYFNVTSSTINLSSGLSASNITIGNGTGDFLNLNSANLTIGRSEKPTTLTVNGNTTIYGSLSVRGNYTSINTITTVETSIVNDAFLQLVPENYIENGTVSSAYPLNVNTGLFVSVNKDEASLNVGNNGAVLFSGLVRSKDYEGGTKSLGNSVWHLIDSTKLDATKSGPDITPSNDEGSPGICAGAILSLNKVIAQSDERLKKDIHIIENALSKITKLNCVSYKWKDGRNGGKTEIGIIAQNIQSVFPEFIHTDSNNYLSVDYPRLSTVLIEGVKELDQRYKSLEDKYNELYELVKGKKTSKPRAKTPEKKTPEKKKTPKPRKPRAKKEDK